MEDNIFCFRMDRLLARIFRYLWLIQVKVANYGGSVNDIFAAIESINGNRTEFVNIVGSGGKLYLMKSGIKPKHNAMQSGDRRDFIEESSLVGYILSSPSHYK
eukprot:381357_1